MFMKRQRECRATKCRLESTERERDLARRDFLGARPLGIGYVEGSLRSPSTTPMPKGRKWKKRQHSTFDREQKKRKINYTTEE